MTTMDTDNVVAVGEGTKEDEEDPYPFDIYISARIDDDFVYRWFLINNYSKPYLFPIVDTLQPNYKFASGGACVVALGSSIYVIGGYDLSYTNPDPFADPPYPEEDLHTNLDPFIDPPYPEEDLHTNEVIGGPSVLLRPRKVRSINIIGGYDPFSYTDLEPFNANGFLTNEVYSIDTLDPDHGWTQCPPMAKKRCGARVFTHDGKIYVVGGFDVPRIYKTTDWLLSGGNGWGDNGDTLKTIDDVDVPSQSQSPSPSQHNNYIEVLNLKEGEWKPAFSSIPDDYLIEHYIDACYVRDKPSGGGGAIEVFVRIVGCSGTQKLYKYDSDDQSWTLHANDFGPYMCRSLVFADDILYSYDNHHVFGASRTEASKVAEGSILCFDVNRPEAEPKQLKGLEDLLPKPEHDTNYYPVATLRHLGCGTKFCLIWEEVLYLASGERVQGSGGGSLTAVHCLKFTVSKVSSEKQGEFDFHGTQPSKSTYFMEAEEVIHITSIPSGAKCVEEGQLHPDEEGENHVRRF